MARKRVVEAPSLHSWEDVNDALRQIAEAQIALGEIQSDMQKQILGAQKVAEEQSKPLNDNVAKLEREIKSFVTDHRDETVSYTHLGGHAEAGNATGSDAAGRVRHGQPLGDREL